MGSFAPLRARGRDLLAVRFHNKKRPGRQVWSTRAALALKAKGRQCTTETPTRARHTSERGREATT